MFASVEEVIRRLMARAETSDVFILNLKLVQGVNRPAARLLAQTQRALQASGKRLVFTEASPWWQGLTDAGADAQAFFTDDECALEYGEDILLAQRFADPLAQSRMALADCALFAGLGADELAVLERVLVTRRYDKGQSIISAGQASDELFVITEGEAMVSIPTQHGIARLDAFSAGTTFGEVAFMDHSPRSANVTALARVECRLLTRAAFTQLESDAPAIKIRLMENIALGLTSTVRQLSRELAALK